MKEQFLNIAEKLKCDNITVEEARSLMLDLLDVKNDWVHVYKQKPPLHTIVLTKSPDGTARISTWRPAYSIFDCQNKNESSYDWQWKLL